MLRLFGTRTCTLLYRKPGSHTEVAETPILRYPIGIIRRFSPSLSAQLPTDDEVMVMRQDSKVIVIASGYASPVRIFDLTEMHCLGTLESHKRGIESSYSGPAAVIEDLQQQLACAKSIGIPVMEALYQQWIESVTTEMVNKQEEAVKTDTAKARKGRSAGAWVVVKSPEEDDWEMVET